MPIEEFQRWNTFQEPSFSADAALVDQNQTVHNFSENFRDGSVRTTALCAAGALLILLAVMIPVIASCPTSCLVCSEDITLCQGLTYILAVPASTKALIITDGSITSVEGFNLSFLLNAALLRLSTNGISTIRDDAFLGLRTLKTLFLDHNQISSSSIAYSTFHELQKLQVLVLSNNILNSIHGAWFKNMKDLIRLNLNGNQLTSITGDSFEMANLGKLKILDLSNNFISSIEKGAFHGLTQLMEIDLSRNRLAVIPDTFSPLAQLSLLNLDQNWWNCTCKLYDLASFLRKYTNSSSRTLRSADNMSCRASENPSVINLLELTEVNCKSALKNPPGVIKNKRRNYEQETALVAIFSFLGGVGLTCLVLALFNRKLQYGKANEHSSENCCCRTLDESQCGHEPRNYLTKGYCNCHLTQENDIKVMSMLGSGREMPLLQENGHQETVKAVSKCTGLKMPLRSIEKQNEQMKNDHFLCLNCRLLQSYPQESSGNTAESNKADVPHQKHVQIRNVINLESIGHWEEDSLTTRLEDYPKSNPAGTGSDTFCRRSSRPPCAFLRQSYGQHIINESSHSLSKTEDDHLKSYKQRGLFAAASSPTNSPEESKEHPMQAKLEGHCSQQNDQCGSLARNKNISLQLDNLLICKYTDCDKYQGFLTAKKENHGKNLRLEKYRSEVKRRRATFIKNDEEVPLSPAIKRMYQVKSVSFLVPDLVTVKREDVKTWGLNEERSLEDQPQHKCIQGIPSTTLARRLPNSSQAKDKERQSSPTPVVPEEKNDALTQKHKRKTKGQDSLTVKLNLHPFRKARVHPEEPLKENSDKYACCQHLQLPHVSKKEETRKKGKTKSNHSVAALEISGNSKQIIYSAVAAGEMLEKNDKNVVASISGPPSKNISAMEITEGTSSSKHSQTLSCASRSPPLSPNGTSGMTVSITTLSSNHSPSISQNAANNIPTSVNSKEKDDKETEVMPFHQNEAKEKGGSFSLSLFNPAENLGFQNPSTEDNLQAQQVIENIVQSMVLEQLNLKQLKRQDESLTRKDESEGDKSTGEPEPPNGDLVNKASHGSGEKALSNGHQIPREEGTNRPKSPVCLSSAISNFQVNEFLTTREESQILHRDKDIEEYGTKQLRADFKTESDELIKMFIPNTAMDPLGLKKEESLTEDEWEDNKCKTLPKNTVKVTIISNTSSVSSSPETRNTYMDNNTNLEMKNNVHMVSNNDLQKASNNQLDEGSSEHKEGTMPPATCQEHSLLPQFEGVNYKEQMETSLLLCNTNKTEISVPQSTLSPTYTDYDKELPLEVEQRKVNISDNTHPSLVLFKDKKPFSI